LGSPEDIFDLDGEGMLIDPAGPELASRGSAAERRVPLVYTVRRELRWFYVNMHGRVPAVGEARAHKVAAASRIAGWLSELEPKHRGAFVVCYDGRRWPVRLVRRFGWLTSVVVRIAAMGRHRGPTETVADAEQAAVTELLADIVAARRPFEGAPCEAATVRLDRLQRAARGSVRRAEFAYADARGVAPCAAPPRSRQVGR
jgi:hypothetical protein